MKAETAGVEFIQVTSGYARSARVESCYVNDHVVHLQPLVFASGFSRTLTTHDCEIANPMFVQVRAEQFAGDVACFLRETAQPLRVRKIS